MEAMMDDASTLITATICVTLQFLRLAVDLIHVASTMDDNATTANKKKSDTVVKKSPSSSAPTENSDANGPKKVSSSAYGSVEEGKPLVAPTSLATTAAATHGNGTTTTTTRFQAPSNRMVLLCTSWIVLSISFLMATLHQNHSHQRHDVHSHDTTTTTATSSSSSSSMILFPSSLLACCSLAFAVEAILAWRDAERERYGSFQRLLQLLAMLVLWGMYASRAVQEWSYHSHDENDNADVDSVGRVLFLSTWDFMTLVAATTAVGLVLLDAWLAQKRPSPARRRSLDQAAANKTAAASLSWQTWGHLLKPYFWPDATNTTALWNRVCAICTWICVVSSKACGLVAPLMLGKAATALAHQDYRDCIKFAIFHAVFTFLASTFKEGQSLVYLSVAQAAFIQLSEESFDHLHHLSLDWHLRKKLGEVLRSMDRGISACDTLMKYLFLWLLPATAECLVVTIIFATYFNYLPLAIAVFYFVFAYVVWTILITLWRKKFRKALVKHDNDWHELFTDSMLNFETVKYFTAEDYEKQRFSDAVSRYQVGTVHMQSSLSLLNSSQQLLLQTCMATALSLAALGIKERMDCCMEMAGCESTLSECCRNVDAAICPGGLQVGDFVTVLSYIGQLFAPLNYLGSVYNAVIMALIDLSNLAELLAESPDVVDAPDAFALPPTNITQPDIAVEFDNVYFHYPTQPENNGLQGLSFKMKRGTTTAIVGPTGAGKTTVSRLLFRFYDVLGGAVKVNGIDVRSLTQTSLRGAIGVVPQATSMFNDTIRSNLRYGRQNATDEDLIKVAHDAQLLQFIESMTDGWETMVGDRGLKLSGGEKQRAAIARCLLKDPPFVLLDEATSALDTITENSIQEALDRLGAERTVLVIAHRLGTIRNADNIIVLKDGKVAEQGTHDQLLANNSVYANMWNMQLHSTAERQNSM